MGSVGELDTSPDWADVLAAEASCGVDRMRGVARKNVRRIMVTDNQDLATHNPCNLTSKDSRTPTNNIRFWLCCKFLKIISPVGLNYQRLQVAMMR